MWNARLDETQAGVKTAGRNINNLRYSDNTISMVEMEEELKILLKKMKEESEKALKCEFEQTLQDYEGQGNLRCQSPWGLKELDIT